MNMKKTFAAIASVAMCASMVSAFATSASAIAEGNAIDFEDGDCSFVYMNVDDDKSDNSVLSVEDYNGSKALKVDLQEMGKTPKVWFDLDKITDRANTLKISTIEMDITVVADNPEEFPGYVGGAIGAAGGFDLKAPEKGQVNPSWSQQAFDGGAYNPGEAATIHVVKKFLLPTVQYKENGTNPFFGVMEWGAGQRTVESTMYIDNIVLKDKAGNAIPVGVFAAAEETTVAETEAAPAEETTAAATEAAPAEETTAAATEAAPAEETTAAATEAAPAETAAATTAAPDAGTTTPVTPTGNAPVVALAAVMAVAGAAAIASKRK